MRVVRRRDGDTRDARERDGGATRWRGVVQRARDAARAGNHASSFALALEGRETEPLLHDAHVVRHELRLTLAAAAEKTSQWPAVADACARR